MYTGFMRLCTHTAKNTDHKCMLTAVSVFIEQVGSMIKESQTQLSSINPLIIPSSFKELALTLVT